MQKWTNLNRSNTLFYLNKCCIVKTLTYGWALPNYWFAPLLKAFVTDFSLRHSLNDRSPYSTTSTHAYFKNHLLLSFLSRCPINESYFRITIVNRLYNHLLAVFLYIPWFDFWFFLLYQQNILLPVFILWEVISFMVAFLQL